MFGSIWGYFYTSFLRYWLKWFIRQVTGKCELQRICAGYKPGAPRTTKAEYSLKNSKSKVNVGNHSFHLIFTEAGMHVCDDCQLSGRD
ncbi:unnamed protein product [Oncorhynchus mykiss]|uniref:ELMO domain-containing protein n=1 Tax=Oncorhynchus mykiss TaxID=8022 RepID=A0A060YEJ3_ONCMY|nr:unnamed protein product [Oncorhynchus mykiss]